VTADALRFLLLFLLYYWSVVFPGPFYQQIVLFTAAVGVVLRYHLCFSSLRTRITNDNNPDNEDPLWSFFNDNPDKEEESIWQQLNEQLKRKRKSDSFFNKLIQGMASGRLVKELKECGKEDSSGVLAFLVDESNVRHLKGNIKGPEGTVYDGGIFYVDIIIPPQYPFEPPKMKFITKVFHPNISSQTGAICLVRFHIAAFSCCFFLFVVVVFRSKRFCQRKRSLHSCYC
jgi:hypothetical protein